MQSFVGWKRGHPLRSSRPRGRVNDLRTGIRPRRVDVPDLPASVVIRMTDGDTLHGTLLEERSDGWLLDEESGRLIHVYSPEVDDIVPREEVDENGSGG